MVQVILLVLILLLWIIVFKLYPIKRVNSKEVVLSATFIMITLVCKRFLTIMIPIFGIESFKIGLEYIPLLIAGYILSPGYAFLIGLCSDLLGLIIVPTGFPFFGFTITMILVCLIPSIVHYNMNSIDESKISKAISILLILLAITASAYIISLENITINDINYNLTVNNKLLLIGLCLIFVIVYFLFIHILKKKLAYKEIKDFSIWVISITLVEIICTLFLTPLWLNIMYGIPFMVSLCIRIIKECFIIPLEVVLGYSILKALKNIT